MPLLVERMTPPSIIEAKIFEPLTATHVGVPPHGPFDCIHCPFASNALKTRIAKATNLFINHPEKICGILNGAATLTGAKWS
jgi:hypothetical protein